MRLYSILVIVAAVVAAPSPSRAGSFELLTGLNTGHYPGLPQAVVPMPGPGFPGTFYDGDRLAGTADDGPIVTWHGSGTPMFPPNHVGALSFLFRRASVPIPGAGQVPLMGIDFLGGPLLDLDGDLSNGSRSLIPVLNATPVVIPDSFSTIGLALDTAAGTIAVTRFDATGTNEGGPGIEPANGTTLVTLSGTSPNGGMDPSIPNPSFDTRVGALTIHNAGVYRIDNLHAELWYDSINPNSASAGVLGTLQHFVQLRGWLVLRDCQTGQFPTLTGAGLGSTLWPAIDTSQVGNIFQTAHGLFGGSATIADGVPGDVFSAHPNGTALAGGDLGVYLDTVVSPRVAATSNAYVYLESAAFGINNSGDPVFTDTIGYDAVIIAQRRITPGDIDGDGDIDETDAALFVEALLDPDSQPFERRDSADINRDCAVNGGDIAPFVDAAL